MKWFAASRNVSTTEELDDHCNTAVEPIAAYVEYFNTIRDKLPADVLLIGDRCKSTLTLNDGRMQSYQIDLDAGSVVVVIDNDAPDENSKPIGLRRFTLRYLRVASVTFTNLVPPLTMRTVDHLADEFEVLPSGEFQHRMLFDGSELDITFRDFALSFEDFYS
jgi:hypothetical protein